MREIRTAPQAAGFRPQVADVAGLSMVFANEGGVKRRIPLTETPLVLALLAPSAVSVAILLWVRFQTVVGKPAARIRLAIGCPIVPRPMNPIRNRVMPVLRGASGRYRSG